MLLWQSFRVFKANISKYVHFPFLTQMARLCTAGFSPNIMSQRCFHFIIYHLHLVISYVIFHSVDILVRSGCYHYHSRHLFLRRLVLEAESLRSGCWHVQVRAPSRSQASPYIPRWKGEWKSLSFFYKGTNPFPKGSSKAPPKASPPNTVILGTRISTYELEGYIHIIAVDVPQLTEATVWQFCYYLQSNSS